MLQITGVCIVMFNRGFDSIAWYDMRNVYYNFFRLLFLLCIYLTKNLFHFIQQEGKNIVERQLINHANNKPLMRETLSTSNSRLYLRQE